MKLAYLVLAACSLHLALSCPLSHSKVTTPPEWDGLRVRFGVFAGMPRTVKEAEQAGWKLDSSVGGCGDTDAKYSGNRYVLNGDPGAMLLFDKNGFIAGIQSGIPKEGNADYAASLNKKYKVLNEEANMWVATAYFVEPAVICSQGRSQDEFKSEGTGTMLAFQVGPTPDDLMRAPHEQDKVLSDTLFNEDRCYPAMGDHYYAMSKDSVCDEMFPAFLMYTKGRLIGFGWIFNYAYSNSERWEVAPRQIATIAIKNPPDCFGAEGPGTSLHVYLVDEPQAIECPQ